MTDSTLYHQTVEEIDSLIKQSEKRYLVVSKEFLTVFPNSLVTQLKKIFFIEALIGTKNFRISRKINKIRPDSKIRNSHLEYIK